MTCPTCGFDAAEDANFCPICGVNLRASRVGDLVEAGARVVGGAASAPTSPPPSATPRQPELTTCPNCSASNSARRATCGRCGASLQAAGDDGDGHDTRAVVPARPMRPGHVAVPTLIVIGTVVLALLLAAVLSATRDRGRGAAARFDRDLYPAAMRAARVVEATASSRLPDRGSISYAPARAIDGDPRTAWNEGAQGTGVGERLTLRLRAPTWVGRVVVHNGYQRTARSFVNNARAARIRITLAPGRRQVVDLLDREGAQAITLAEPALTQGIEIEILAVYDGNRYEDLALSEVALEGWVPIR